MGKNAILRLLIISLLIITCRYSEAFTQGQEFMRLRTGSIAAEEGPVSGEIQVIEYFIAPEDVMEVNVWQNADLTKDVIVGPDGYISYPLLGRIKVVGMTIGQLEETLRARFSEYIKNPQVSVMIKKFAGSQVIIMGRVNYPGIYTYKGTMDLIKLVALAGDFTDEARRDSLIVIRGNFTQEVEVKRVNVERVIKKGITSTEMLLKPNDLVYVPRSFISDFNKFIGNIKPIMDLADEALTIINLRGQIRTLQDRRR